MGLGDGGMMEIRDWLLVISMVLHFANTIWGYIERRNDKTSEKIAEIETRIAGVERVVSEVKTASNSAPTHSDLGKVYDAMRQLADSTNQSINNLAGTVNQLVGENRGQSDTLRLILNRITDKGINT